MKLSASSAEDRFGAKPPSSPTLVLCPASVERLAQGVEHLRPHADGLGERRGADRHDHEFLEVDRIVGVRPAVDDVHHRHRETPRLRPADVAVERQPGRLRRGLGRRQRYAQDRVGAEPGLVGRAVERDQRAVDRDLILRRPCRRSPRRSRPRTALTAFSTPLPPNRSLSPSRSSTASCAPVDAPDGTAARPVAPSARSTSTSTVGLPRLSRISRARMSGDRRSWMFPLGRVRCTEHRRAGQILSIRCWWCRRRRTGCRPQRPR